MESVNTENTQSQPSPDSPNERRRKPVLLLLLLAIVVVAAAAAVIVLKRPQEVPETKKIGYSEGTVLLKDSGPVELTPPDAITLEYSHIAMSSDGQNFECKINNAQENQYDMYIDIYADAALTDQLFLSELFRPGSGFQQIKLNRALEKGNHTGYLVFTQVEDDQSTMHNQMVVTINLIVQ